MKKINNLLVVIILLVSLFIAAYNIIETHILVRVLISLSSIIIILVPKIIRKFLNISDKLELMYLLFIFFAYLLGTVINFYDRISFYDTLMHFISGIFEGYIAMEMLNKFKINKLHDILFIISFVALVSVLWEVFEFTSSVLLNCDPQRVQLTGVKDTMKDLIMGLLGGIIIVLSYKSEK